MCLKYLLAWCHCIMRGLLGVWRNLLIIAQWRRKKHLAWSCLCGRQKDQLLQNVHSSNPSNSSDSNDDNFWQKLANQQHFVGRSNQSNSDRNCSFSLKKLQSVVIKRRFTLMISRQAGAYPPITLTQHGRQICLIQKTNPCYLVTLDIWTGPGLLIILDNLG